MISILINKIDNIDDKIDNLKSTIGIVSNVIITCTHESITKVDEQINAKLKNQFNDIKEYLDNNLNINNIKTFDNNSKIDEMKKEKLSNNHLNYEEIQDIKGSYYPNNISSINDVLIKQYEKQNELI